MGLLGVLAVTVDGRWHPAIGDPTFLGWLTAASYFLAAFLCRRAARRTSGKERRLRSAWLALSLLMLALGINKQLDLQSLLTEIGKDAALEHGWYYRRAEVQKLFIATIVAGAVIVGAAVAYWLRGALRQLWLTLLGAVFIVAFVLIRASSFHHVDLFLSGGPFGVRMNWVLELGGICCVIVGALRFSRPRRRRLRAR